jgi:glycerol uptake facilitator-like aquaporin
MSSLKFHNTVSEHVCIPEINPHCILSQIYALFTEFYYAFVFVFVLMKSTEHNFLKNTERTFHCIIMHIFKKQKQKQKQSIIKLNKQSINLT